jgi:hypothetical protein
MNEPECAYGRNWIKTLRKQRNPLIRCRVYDNLKDERK